MNGKYYFLVVALLVYTSLLANEEQSPSIIMIYVDDMGYEDFACYGGENRITPNIDKLAEQGIMFTNFYSASHICSPARAGLLTGCYPQRAGVPEVFLLSQNGISKDVVTIPEMLKKRGYISALIGKWHLGHQKEFLPLNHGFDYFYGTPFSNDMKDENGVLPFYENNEVIETDPDNNMLTTRYTEKAVEFIANHHEEPFFLYLAHNMPHTPLGVSGKFTGKSGYGLYADVIMEIDWSVSEVVKALEQYNIDKSTLLIISSDNGPSLKQGIFAGNAGDLREGKGSTFDGGHKVPGIFYMPETILPGKAIDDVASQLDIYPTIAEITGAALPQYLLDGESLWETLTTGAAHSREAFYFFRKDDLQAMRKGDFKVHKAHSYRSPYPQGEKRKSSEKYKVFDQQIETSVFNLVRNPGETENLINECVELKDSFLLKMQSESKRINSQCFSPDIIEQ
jgi:arylsulfatase A